MVLDRFKKNPAVLYAVLGLMLVVTALLALNAGTLKIPFSHVLGALGWPGMGTEDFEQTAILQIRLPRVVLALLIGAALAQAGAAMQGIFRNPLADPGLIGISSGAALAAVAGIVLGAKLGLTSTLPASVLPLLTFAGGGLAALCAMQLAQSNGYTRVATLLLAGLALNALCGAGVGFLAYIADDLALRSLMFWMYGSLGKAGWSEILPAVPLLLIPLLLIPREARALDALLLGEAEAGHLGFDVERVKRRLMMLAVLAVAVSVSLAGIIGFVGLVVPHLIRLWAGPSHRLLLVSSALAGALLLTLADIAARVVLAPAELPIGILTVLCGGPFFLALLIRYRSSAETP